MGFLTDLADQTNRRIDKEIDKYFDRKADNIVKQISKVDNDRFSAPAATRIDEFRSNIIKEGGIQRTNQFRFNISIPNFISDDEKFISSTADYLSAAGLPDYNNTLSLLCQEIDLPAKSLNTREIKVNGQKRVVPANYNWDNVTVTFLDTNSCIVYNTIYKWMDGINNPATNVGRFYDDYVSELKIDYLDKNNNMLGYIRLVDAFPISLSRSNISYTDRDSVMKTKVTFTYVYQSNKDYSSEMLYNIFNNLTDGSSANLLDKAKSLVKMYHPGKIISNSLKSDQYKEKRKNDAIEVFGVRTKPLKLI